MSSPAAASAAASNSLSSVSPKGRPFRSLKTAREFDRVFAEGKRVRCGPFSVVVRRHPESYAVGFKLGRKVGNAVVRNRLRRRFRSLFDAWGPGDSGAGEFVILAGPAAATVPYRDLSRRLTPVLERAGLRLRRGGAGG